ncbi:uncharacterized protein LOC129259933 [Lytechinus pictus]|uniref:uncharacterized protein LOC129259933 n=1 Tax=Lytechinus pictus TaxID=7653 RepID=UPI00240D02EC|nr:uncharacterized protein LOC129259933 [Lytechinus pictus]
MAIIMKSCCCFETIEKGTVASAIYSMLTSIIAFGWVTYRIQPLQTLFQDMEGDHEMHIRAIYISYMVAVILTISLVASAMILLIGTIKGKRFFMIPFLIIILITIVLQVPFTIFLLCHFVKTNFVNLTILVHVLFNVPLVFLNIASFFCVIARFQQLSFEPEDSSDSDIESLDEIKIENFNRLRRESQHITILKIHTTV